MAAIDKTVKTTNIKHTTSWFRVQGSGAPEIKSTYTKVRANYYMFMKHNGRLIKHQRKPN